MLKKKKRCVNKKTKEPLTNEAKFSQMSLKGLTNETK